MGLPAVGCYSSVVLRDFAIIEAVRGGPPAYRAAKFDVNKK